ncbi:transposase [Rubidibacter lacunae]
MGSIEEETPIELADMHCPFCDPPKSHKHGRISHGIQRFKCVQCNHTFVEIDVS